MRWTMMNLLVILVSSGGLHFLNSQFREEAKHAGVKTHALSVSVLAICLIGFTWGLTAVSMILLYGLGMSGAWVGDVFSIQPISLVVMFLLLFGCIIFLIEVGLIGSSRRSRTRSRT
jgi:hypothetical protein